MIKRIFTGLHILALFTFGMTEELQTIHLKPGLNEVAIKINNKSALNFSAAYLDVRPEDLPEGVTISFDAQRVDVSANTLTESGLILQVNADDNLNEGFYDIPLILRDDVNHSWNFTITAEFESQKPESYQLAQNYPNPFNATTQIKYDLAAKEKQNTRLIIYDVLGRQIRTLVEKEQAAGTYEVIWDGRDEAGKEVASGIYLYKLISGLYAKTNKMILMK